MILGDVKYLKCIECGGQLEIKPFAVAKNDKQECLDGKLRCISCKHEYPVIGGIPRIFTDNLILTLVVPRHPGFFQKYGKEFKQAKQEKSSKIEKLKKRTAESFGFEWLEYKSILTQFEKDWHRYFSPFIQERDIKGRVVADIGCGMAKHGYFTAKFGAKKYIGVDLSDAVESAYKNTRKFKPLIVQADIYSLPLDGGQINLYYSIGVLHHLPDPEGGFKSITGLMKKGSRVFIWVYGKHNNFRALYIYNPIRVITTRMPRSILYPLCHIPALVLHTINLAQKGLDKVGLQKVSNLVPLGYYKDYPYNFKVSDSFDVFGTPKQVYYTKDDIIGWFKRAKLGKFTLAYDQVQGIKGFGTR